MHVVITTDGIFPHSIGGIQRHSRYLIEELAIRPDVQVTVVHPHVGTPVFEGLTSVTEITVPDIDTGKNYLKECKKYSERVLAEVRKLDYDILYAQGLTIWEGIENLTPKLIVNPHGLESYQATTVKAKLVGVLVKKVQNHIFKHARYVASEGGILTTILESVVPKEKVKFLPNAIYMPEGTQLVTKPDAGQPMKLLFVARFANNKGIDILMEAVKQLNAEGYEDKITFNLGGKGPMFEHYSTNYQFNNVNYLGFVLDQDLSSLYSSNEAFVLPTKFEGMPTVVLEAMSHYLPVIVTNVGGTSELIDSSNGFLIEKESVTALKSAILDYFNMSAEDKDRLSQNAYDKVNPDFTWPAVVDQHLELFNHIAANPI